MASDPIAEAIVEAVSHDDTIAGAARELTVQAIRQIDEILLHGTPAAKLQILRSFVPAMIRAGEARQTNEEMEMMRREFHTVMAAMRDYDGPGEGKQDRDEMVDDIEPDLPPEPDPPVPSQS